MNDINNNIANLDSLYRFIKDKDDDVIVRGWDKNDFKNEHPEDANETKDKSSFFYIRESGFSRFLQRISDWTIGAKRKQGLAKQYITAQLINLMKSTEIQGEIKNNLLDFNRKILNIQGDLQVVHIKNDLKLLLNSLKSEISQKPALPQTPVAGTISDSKKFEHNPPIYPQQTTESTTDTASLNMQTDEQNSSVVYTADSQPLSENFSKNTLMETSGRPLEVNNADKGISFSESKKNPNLLSIPKGITCGSKHAANQVDTDSYFFPEDKYKKTDRSQLSHGNVHAVAFPQLKTQSPIGTTFKELNAYKINLLAAYRAGFDQIAVSADSQNSFSVSIAMPEPPLQALLAACEALAAALREFRIKHPNVSIYIQTPNATISEKLLEEMKREPINA